MLPHPLKLPLCLSNESASAMTYAIPSISLDVLSEARARQQVLTKPPGSLGKLEALAIQLAAFQGNARPSVRPCCTLLFAADHPVTEHGVSPYPSSVTQAMVQNFESGGAAASVLCRAAQMPLHVIDAGVFGGQVDSSYPGGDIRCVDAMNPAVFEELCKRGAHAARTHASGNRLTIFGEMGIGNSTVAAAVAAALFRVEDAASLVGAGTGAEGATLQAKRQVVRDAVRRLDGQESPAQLLQRVGGRELVCIYAAMKEVLTQRSAVLVDGFIVTVVAAVIAQEEPNALAGMIFAHRSAEQGHRFILERLKVQALLELDMRLGEASGALMAFPLLERACLLHNEMATFASAGIAGVEG
jgi:nicotinate-nucleotide--dimethylbenzimidazole phosphoribosyltransferase